MARPSSLRGRLVADQVLLILFLAGGIMAVTFFGARRAIESLSRMVVSRAAAEAERELRAFFDPVAGGLEVLSAWGQAGLLEGEDRRRLVEPLAARLPQISDGRVTDGTAPPGGGVHWTEPRILTATGQPGLSATIAFEGQDGSERVITVDVLLDEVTRYARRIEVSERGSLWLLTEDRRLLAWPEAPALWGDQDPRTALLEIPSELGLPLVDDAADAFAGSPAAGRTDPVRFASGGEDWWGLVRPFDLSAERRLLIAVVVPHADLLSERTRLVRWVFFLALAALLAAAARAVVVARRVSRPIEALVAESGRISRGDLEPGRPIVTELAEVRELADAHHHMRGGLKTLMKLERDLQLARQIQQKTLPGDLPRLPGFDLVAWNQPADETGGDSYDVIGLDDDDAITTGEAGRAVLMLADATGHGIGPALSVTQLRAMLRMAVRTGIELGDVATHVNDQLYADLPGNRFITAWLAVLDVGEASLTTMSAGQAPLLYYRAVSGEVEEKIADTPPFGLLPALPIPAPGPVRMQPGDIYVVLSDGFFEAVDPAGVEFGTARVSDLVRRYRQAPAAEILAALKAAISEFTGDAPADDDRTALILKRAR